MWSLLSSAQVRKIFDRLASDKVDYVQNFKKKFIKIMIQVEVQELLQDID